MSLWKAVFGGGSEASGTPHLRMVNSDLNFRLGGRAAAWGNGHSIVFNDEWTLLELSWLLDGTLFNVGRAVSMAEIRGIIEGSFPKAYKICIESNRKAGQPRPEESDGYNLAIHKFFLSYAVRNGVSFKQAQTVYKRVTGS